MTAKKQSNPKNQTGDNAVATEPVTQQTVQSQSANEPQDLGKVRTDEHVSLSNIRINEEDFVISDDAIRRNITVTNNFRYTAPKPRDGMVQMWIIVENGGLQKAADVGWRPRKSDTLSERERTLYVPFSDGRFDDYIPKHDTVLCERSIEYSKMERSKYVQADRAKLKALGTEVKNMMGHQAVAARNTFELTPFYEA